MRTTLTLDRDVERLLQQAMRAEKQSLNATVNAALRRALALYAASPTRPFVVRARPMRLRAGIDPAHLNRLSDELEEEGLATVTRRARRGAR